MRIKIVGVMGSSTESFPQVARPLGKIIAEAGFHLLTGGGMGVMEEVCRGFYEVKGRRGLCIGIIPGDVTIRQNRRRDRSSKEQALSGKQRIYSPWEINQWVEIPIKTHLPMSGEQGKDTLSRNHINVLTSDILIALPGGAGTYSEVMLRIEYGGEVILYIGDGKIYGRSASELKREIGTERVIEATSLAQIKEILNKQNGS